MTFVIRFHAVFQPQRTDAKPHEDHQKHEKRHAPHFAGLHMGKGFPNLFGIHPLEPAGEHFEEI